MIASCTTRPITNPIPLKTNIQQNEKGNKRAERQFLASVKARQCSFWRIALPNIHYWGLAAHCQPHCTSHYIPISLQTDCEHNKTSNTNAKRRFVALARARRCAFQSSPRRAFTIGSWRCTANCTARPITPQFPSKLIFNITKQVIQTKNGGFWRQPRLGDAPFGVLPCLASTTGFSIKTRYLVIHPPKGVYCGNLGVGIGAARGASLA